MKLILMLDLNNLKTPSQIYTMSKTPTAPKGR